MVNIGKKKILCVDWDRRSVRLVVASVGRGAIALEDAHQNKVPRDVDVDDPKSMGELLSRLLKQHGLSYRRVVVDVSRHRAVINRLKLPPTPMEDVAAAVQFQAMRELPFPTDEAVVDFVIIEKDDKGCVTEVLLTAVRRDAMQRLKDTCKEAGLTPVRIGLRPYANLVSVRYQPGLSRERVLFVDVGPAMTEIDVFRDGVLSFSRSANVLVPIRSSKAGFEENGDIDGSTSLDAPAVSAVRDLEVEVTRTLQAYRASEPNAVIDRIVIGGGTGLEEALRDTLDERFGLPCELYDPSGPLGLDPDEGQKLRSFSAALGLAWGLSREGLLELDYLNPKKPIPKSAVIKRRVRTGAIVGGAIAASLAAWLIVDTVQHKRELTSLNQQVQSLRVQEAAWKVVNASINRVKGTPDAVWLDDLLTITECTRGPIDPETNMPKHEVGERLLITNVRFDGNDGVITMRVLAKEFEDFEMFQKMLSSQTAHRVEPVATAELVDGISEIELAKSGIKPIPDMIPTTIETTTAPSTEPTAVVEGGSPAETPTTKKSKKKVEKPLYAVSTNRIISTNEFGFAKVCTDVKVSLLRYQEMQAKIIKEEKRLKKERKKWDKILES